MLHGPFMIKAVKILQKVRNSLRVIISGNLSSHVSQAPELQGRGWGMKSLFVGKNQPEEEKCPGNLIVAFQCNKGGS